MVPATSRAGRISVMAGRRIASPELARALKSWW